MMMHIEKTDLRYASCVLRWVLFVAAR